ncbi:MAG: MFS transporter [Desulfobacterales bacterium]|nr:MFS transporter [Desulfobacterales bacterium]
MPQTVSGDGGLKSQALRFELLRGSIFLILIATYVLVYFHRMAPAVVATDLMSAFGTSGASLGSLSAIYFFVYAGMQIPSGVLADTLGTRTSVIGGNLAAGLGSILFGLAQSFSMACAGRFLVGLGVSVVFVSIMKNNAMWFSESRFGFMSGLTLLIGNLGSVVAAGPLAAMLEVHSWRNVFVGIGMTSLTLGAMAFFFVRNRPEDFHFPSIEQMEGRAPVAARHQHWIRDLLGVLRQIQIWPGFWVQMGMTGGIYAFMGLWGVLFLQDVYRLGRGEAARYQTLMLLAFAVGSLFFGWFSDRLGKRKPVLISAAIAYALGWVFLLYLPWSPGPSGYILFGWLGFTGSGFVISFAAAKEVIHPALSGMAISVINTGAFIGATLIQPFVGWVLDLTWDGAMAGDIRVYAETDYHNGLLVMLIFAVMGVIGAFRLQETFCRNISAALKTHES